MNKLVITGGNFSPAGNFNAYTLLGEEGRIHISAQQMSSLGWSKNEDVKFPLFVVVVEKEFHPRDANGEISTTTPLIKRLQASAVFKTEIDALRAIRSAHTFSKNVENVIAKAQATVDIDALDEATLNALV